MQDSEQLVVHVTDIPFARCAAMKTHSFSVVVPATWNGLPVGI